MDAKTVRRIEIKVNSTGAEGLREVAKNIDILNKSTKSISKSIDAFSGMFAGIFAGIGLRELANISDSMELLNNRIESLAGRTLSAGDILERLSDVSRRTKADIADTAQVFTRLQASLKEVNVSSQTTVLLTETLQNIFRLSGATTAETTNSLIQLSQAFASGTLRGDEFRSIMEQSSVFGDILSKSLGKTRGEMKKMSEEGKITSVKVLKALLENMDDINTRAKTLGQTFGQTLTVAFNDFKVSVLDLNKALGASSAFAKGIEFITKNIELLAGALAGIAVVLSAAAFKSLAATLGAIGAPVALAATAVAALAASLIYLVKNFEKVSLSIQKAFFEGVAKQFKTIIFYVDRLIEGYNYLTKSSEEYKKSTISESIQEEIKALNRLEEGLNRTALADAKRRDDQILSAESQKKRDLAAAIAAAKAAEATKKKSEYLRDLNLAYEAGTTSVREYFDILNKINNQEAKRQFLTGKKDLEQYNSELTKIKAQNIDREFQQGLISFSEMNDAIEKNSLDKLNFQLQAGKISLREYNSELVAVTRNFEAGSAFRKGTEDFIKSAGTISQGIAGIITKTYDTLGEALFQFTLKGQRDFSEMTQAILDDLWRIIIRAKIISPLAEGLLNFSFAPAQAAAAGPTTVGQARGLEPFASGGIISGRSEFLFGNGKMGMAGEAGPEAILPLRRGPGGELGVQSAGTNVTVNVINNSSSVSVEQQESTDSTGAKTIDLIIHNKVREGIASGRYDRAFSQTYGMTRRGS